MKTKVFVGAKVSCSKNGNGEIVRIITKSTGYVEVRWESGKTTREMAFNLLDENGEALKSKPMVKAKVDNRTPQQKMADELVDLANVSRLRNNSYFGIAFEKLGAFVDRMMKIDSFAARIATSIEKTMSPYGAQVAYVSPKQAWCLACAAIENGINL